MEAGKKKNDKYRSVSEEIRGCEQVLRGASAADLLHLLSPYVTQESLALGLANLKVVQVLEKQQRKLTRQTSAAFQKHQQERDASKAALMATRNLANS